LAGHLKVADHRHRFILLSGPEVLAHEIALLLPVHTGQMDRTFTLANPTTCETAYFGGIEIIM